MLPESADFGTLHEAIQDSLGWENYHLFEFRDKNGKNTIARADFEDDFVVEGDEAPVAGKLKLTSFFTRVGTKCLYVYDFGDDWHLEVQLIRTVELPEEFERRLLDGARACPQEDCGGVYGYDDCVKITSMSFKDLKKEDRAEDLAERKEWLGKWDPEKFNLAATKKDFDE
jgi:hypothetical protein